MSHEIWIKESPVANTVCDADGIIFEMNDKAAVTFQKDGGRALGPQELLGRLETEVVAFAGSERFEDDFTLLLARVEGS